jgi:hypothetical protein
LDADRPGAERDQRPVHIEEDQGTISAAGHHAGTVPWGLPRAFPGRSTTSTQPTPPSTRRRNGSGERTAWTEPPASRPGRVGSGRVGSGRRGKHLPVARAYAMHEGTRRAKACSRPASPEASTR